MKNIYILVCIATLFLINNSCQEDFLDRAPLDKISQDAVFNSAKYAEAYLYNIYNYTPNGYGLHSIGHKGSTGFGRETSLDCTTDISVNKSGWTASWTIVNSGFSPTNNDFDSWNSIYKAVYLCNDFIDNLNKSKLPDNVKTKLGAEARFNRALQYFELVRRYGDVPFFRKPQDFNDTTTIFVPRTDKKVIYDFIDSELTDCAEVLPWAKDAGAAYLGRATKEACIAIGARAMLFAERYSRSAELNKTLIDAVTNGTSDRELSPDYRSLFTSYGGDKEVIFEVLFDGSKTGNPVDNLNRPAKVHGSWGGQWNPTQNLVDAYEMKNGKMINEPGSGYDPQNPYANRDSRLDASILHHGSYFMGYTMDLTWQLVNGVWKPDPTVVDAPRATGLSTITGYYIRKFMDETAPLGVEFGQGKQSWKEIRLAEVYLNYAEAQYDVDPSDPSILSAINKVRERAGQPDLTSITMNRILHEREVELAFEGDRFWTIRRHHLGNQLFNPTGNGNYMNCCYYLKDNAGNVKYVYSANDIPAGTTLAYPTNTSPMAKHNWYEKNYLFPIPQAEMDKNTFLEQNPGY